MSSSWATTSSGLYVPEAAAPQPRPIAVDLFAGAGGFSCGFHMAGFHVAAAVEFDRDAAVTYLLNLGGPDTVVHTGPGMSTGKRKQLTEGWAHERCAEVLPEAGTGWISHRGEPRNREDYPNDYLHEISQPPAWDEPACEHLWRADVRDLTGGMILEALGLDQGDVTAVIGGPPCQGFSRAGQRDVMDPRNSLVFDFARLVCEIQPKTFVMENVTGIVDMLTPEGLPVLDALAMVFEDGGFGDYDALRRSLYASSGNAAALKGKPRQKTPTPEPEPDGLFELDAAVV